MLIFGSLYPVADMNFLHEGPQILPCKNLSCILKSLFLR
jgi:hypothetical protein